ncbi:MAG: site-specific integrase, partial [Acidobacteriota bacterium]
MLEEYLKQFLEHLRYERNVSTHTLRNYSSDLEQFHEHIAPAQTDGTRKQIAVKDIDHLTIREWMASLHADNKKKTSIARKLASLRTFFQFL